MDITARFRKPMWRQPCGFKSHTILQYVVGSSMVEYRIVAPVVAGSIPVPPPKFEHVSEWSKEADCNPVVRWFESNRALHMVK